MDCSERILISCAGLGMGNASRIVAVLEALEARAAQSGRKIECVVVAWGAGYRFLSEYLKTGRVQFDLRACRSYCERQSRFQFLSYPKIYLQNTLFLRRLVQKFQPSLILLDSDYHFPAFAGVHCPLVYLGQALDVVDRAKKWSYRAKTWREFFNFLIFEQLDTVLQRLFCDLILVPSFVKHPQWLSHKVHKIPLIVREHFADPAGKAVEPGSMAILLSGSGIHKETLLSFASSFALQTLQTVPSAAESLMPFDVIFTQGGLSSISECLALAKYLVVIPIKNHPEQNLNALAVERLGLGICASLEELKDFSALRAKVMHGQMRRLPCPVKCDGARTVADEILARLATREAEHPAVFTREASPCN